ncbi:MAG: ABC transporter ATP-binding protein [Firmicutes bacterium]|nr:ABC transporter ATP-binding protein [Bacillota bacterium]
MSRPDKQGTLEDLFFFRPYLAPHTGRLVLSALLMLFGAGAAIYFPYATKIAIDRYILPQQTAGLVSFLLATGGIMLLSALATAGRLRLMAYMGQDVIRRIRRDLFAHLQRLPVAYFDKMPVGKLVTRLTGDVDALAELFGGTILQIFGDILILVGFLVVMVVVDWRLALVPLTWLPPLVFVFTFLEKKIHKAEDRVREEASTVNAVLQENVAGVRIVQAFWAQEKFQERFEVVNRRLLAAGLRAIKVFGFFWPIVDFTWVAGAGLLLFCGGIWVLRGTLTIGTLMAFLGYANQFFGPLHGLSQASRVIQRALAGAVRIRQIMSILPESSVDLPPMPAIRGRVEMVNLNFAYEDRPVLCDIDLRVAPGEMVAVVGRTGAGKTSLINLLCRFYRPCSGQILVDGEDISRYDVDSYRRQLALVLQEPFLFSGTIRENLRYGRIDATDEEMEAALAAVGLKESLAAQGLDLDSVLQERGSNLSFGQRQLLALARALLADPRIIILDEATAHVDTITERKLQAAIARVLAGRTAFVIAHRLSTVQGADRILVIEDGRIVEAGRHEELLAARGRYWELCRRQGLLPSGFSSLDPSTAR